MRIGWASDFSIVSLNLISNERIDVILHFVSHANPLNLLDLVEGYYNAEGYAVTAKAIIKK